GESHPRTREHVPETADGPAPPSPSAMTFVSIGDDLRARTQRTALERVFRCSGCAPVSEANTSPRRVISLPARNRFRHYSRLRDRIHFHQFQPFLRTTHPARGQ